MPIDFRRMFEEQKNGKLILCEFKCRDEKCKHKWQAVPKSINTCPVCGNDGPYIIDKIFSKKVGK